MKLWLQTLLCAAFACCAVAQADEVIVAYDSRIAMRADGSLDVVETIRVRAEGQQIRRGIYRDFPTRYRDRYGNRVVVQFEMLELTRNGTPEPWFTESLANGVRVNTGNDDFLQVPAEHVFRIHYRTTRQTGFFADHDELYWNAIGTGWAFPIESGGAVVTLPKPVPVADMTAEGYTGAQGAKAQGFAATLSGPGQATWRLTRPLQAGEGFTLVLSFPKGVLAEPTRVQRLRWLLGDNVGVLIALLGAMALIVYCVQRWRQVGRDPRPGVVIARYEPPAGHSPAGIRYLRRMGYDNRCFSCDLLALAVDGVLRIDQRKKKISRDEWSLERTAASSGEATPAQQALLSGLFTGGAPRIVLRNTNAERISGARTRHTAELAKQYQPVFFLRNLGSVGVATAIAVVSMVLALVLGAGGGALIVVALGAAMALALVIFTVLIKAPTVEGRKLLDEIEGLKRYLAVAERDELASLPGPDAAPVLDAKRYEYLLPYAVALEVEDAWTEKFTLAVGAAAAAAATAGIAWYQGHATDLGGLSQALGNSLSSTIASSSSPPGSSSGSGGGGSSGGGGGGGGGGGR